MTKILKIEAFSGASGDMFLSALAQLSDNFDDLKTLPSKLNFDDHAEIIISDVKKNGIACKHIKVVEKAKQHHHRHLKDIILMIKNSSLTENAKKIAIDIFEIIGIAEAKVHNIPIEKIHFHEVGAVDSIIDICGAAFFLDKLKIDKSYLTTLITGKGFINTEHGKLPIPAPATKLIIESIPYLNGDEEGEKLTPTGAAIIKYLNPCFEQIPTIDIKTAYGPGEKDFITPNLLRLSISEINEEKENLINIETNIDDIQNEYLGIEFQNKLFENGAIDFYISQVIMKKGRPGNLLSIICKKNNLENIANFLFNSTSTIGLRYYPIERIELERNVNVIDTEFGKFHVKISKAPNGIEKVKPESEEILKYALENNIDPKIISNKIIGNYEKDNRN
ncbi:MAG: nickel pincer cofactor biosynthesis protein LarC [Ignavibacteriae bacterium]|nr:nickel pincer cofactor biosynthesis protein LarC [Ignavibacteriota bacterium]